MTLGDDRYGARPWGERLRAWREDVKQWSRAEFRDQIEAASYRLNETRGNGVDARLIGRWETGRTRSPQPVYRRLLAHIGAPLPEMPNVLDDPEDGEEMDRRRFLQSVGVMTISVGVQAAAQHGTHPISARVDSTHVRNLRSNIDNLYRQDQAIGGERLAKVALQGYYDVRRLLDEADYTRQVGHDLMDLAAESAVCAGWLSFDGGDQQTARALYAEVYLLADQSDNTILAIQALEKMSLQASFIANRMRYRGSVREGLRIGERIAEFARSESSARLHALIAVRQATAYAAAGAETAFRGSMTRAWREMDRTEPDEDVSTWLQFVTRAEIKVQQAKGHRYLGQPEDAVRIYRECLAEPDIPARNCTNYRAQLAASLQAIGDNVSALAEGAAILPVLERAVSSPRSVAELYPVRRAAAQMGEHDFCSRYDRLALAANLGGPDNDAI